MLNLKKVVGVALLALCVVSPALAECPDFPADCVFQEWCRMMDGKFFAPPRHPRHRHHRCHNFSVAFEVEENDAEFIVKMATPGVPKEAFNLSVENGVLAINVSTDFCPKMKRCAKAKAEADAKAAEAKDAKTEAKDAAKCEKCGEKNCSKCPKRPKNCPMLSRKIKLPPNVDGEKISATYKDGVLTVSIPKVQPEKKPARQIPVL